MSFENVAVTKKANIYFEGKCVSHTVTMVCFHFEFFQYRLYSNLKVLNTLMQTDGIRKSVGVILPNTGLRFDLTTKEIMEVVEGDAFVSINGGEEQTFSSGTSWTVEAGGYFVIRADAPVHYVCHFE